ncbi:aminotransferase IV [Synergistales bacterium]|nr:aminotransferase IV [Synergistales bacterium]
MSICYFNGKFRPTSETALPVTDLIIARGIGVFDSLRSYEHKPFALREHLDRLRTSAEGINIRLGGIMEEIKGAIIAGLRRDDCPVAECVIKPFITGGDVNDFGTFPNPRFFVIFEEGIPVSDAEYKNGVTLSPSNEHRPFPMVKSVNYLVGIMQSAEQSDVLECLYCPDGEIMETLRASFFMCKDGKIITAPVGRVLNGITRKIILEIARENGFKIEERAPKLSELADADETFITSTWKEVMPVTRVGDIKIGSGKQGPVAAHLLKLFRENKHRWLWQE